MFSMCMLMSNDVLLRSVCVSVHTVFSMSSGRGFKSPSARVVVVQIHNKEGDDLSAMETVVTNLKCQMVFCIPREKVPKKVSWSVRGTIASPPVMSG